VARHRFLFFRQTGSSVCLLFVLTLALSLLAAPSASAQSRTNRPSPRYLQLSPPDQMEGAEILRDLRAAGPAGDYYLEFDLRVLPRRGEETRVPGRLWGGRNPEGPISRLALKIPAAHAVGTEFTERRILVQGGPRPAAWAWPAGDGDATIAIDDSALFTPLAGTDLSAFDLQMPFLYWTDFVYEGKTRLQDRPADTFLLYPPASLATRRPDLVAMRVYLDPQYHALVQAEQLGEGERVLKSFRVVSLRKIGESWIVRSVELRDEATRNKTRFVVTAAALELDFSGSVFDPGGLAAALAPPAKLTRLAE
jgi:hypothetical protein